jgi:hypothetical protein
MFLLIRDIILHRCSALCVFSTVLFSLIYEVSFITIIHLCYRFISILFFVCSMQIISHYRTEANRTSSPLVVLSYSYMLLF